MFDSNYSILASKGIWLYNHNVEFRNASCMSGKCGYFNSSLKAKLEIPMFSAAFSSFGAFSVRFFFKRTAGVSGVRSLVDNSMSTDVGSLVAQSDVDAALGYFANADSTKAPFSVPVSMTIIDLSTKRASMSHMYVERSDPGLERRTID